MLKSVVTVVVIGGGTAGANPIVFHSQSPININLNININISIDPHGTPYLHPVCMYMYRWMEHHHIIVL